MYSNINSNDCISIKPSRDIADLYEDVKQGLLNKPRSLPPKYFYDARGSQLFDQICDTSEYYPTRTEAALLDQHGTDIIDATRPDEIIELGSGSSQKTRYLFDACEDQAHICSYAPFDVCESMLCESATIINMEYDWLQVNPMVGDYNAGLDNLPKSTGRRLFVFLGGTIGNFDRGDARRFLDELRSCMQAGDHLLLGVDRIKDSEVLNAAYNDAQGITAQFNLNVLNVINRELEADFNLSDFEHLARFNNETRQIEMYLVSRIEQTISIEHLNEKITLLQGEKILTEISCKYDTTEIESLLNECGLGIRQHYEPENRYFSLFLTTLSKDDEY
ncbi:MAG: L-histidine N(alpha)-methyltransferase [Thiotrichales bacterium]|nr:L-histidine N(alpha)-methyltransferase [Thiotrichales bacterium]